MRGSFERYRFEWRSVRLLGLRYLIVGGILVRSVERFPGGGQQLIDLRNGVVRQAFDYVNEVGFRVDQV